MSFHFVLIYALTIFIASIIPGPSMLLALTHGMQYGVRRTIASAMGNLSVTLVQAIISVAGLGAVLVASETLFLFIKYAGAGYLVYMGISLLRAPAMKLTQGGDQPVAGNGSLKKMFLQAAVVTAGNPKAIVFFTAVFPQFIDLRTTYLIQFFLLMGIGALIAFGCFMLYAFAGQRIVHLFAMARWGRYLNKAVGSAFILAALGLAAGRR
jgi:threonine/homoserine/homoserine lactone efflux protein